MIKWAVVILLSLIVLVNLVVKLVLWFLLLKAMCVKLCRRRSVKVESEKPKSINDRTSMTTLNFEETDEIERPKQDIAEVVERRVKLSY